MIRIEDTYDARARGRAITMIAGGSHKEVLVTEAASPGDTGPEDKAIHRYEVVETGAPLLELRLRMLGVLIAGLLSQGDIVFSPGGERTKIKDRASGATVLSFTRGFGHDTSDMTTHLNEQLTALSAGEFERKWLSSGS